MKTAGCIQDHYIKIVLGSMFHSGFGNIHRADLIAHGEYRHINFLAVDLQLFNSSRTIYIAGN